MNNESRAALAQYFGHESPEVKDDILSYFLDEFADWRAKGLGVDLAEEMAVTKVLRKYKWKS